MKRLKANTMFKNSKLSNEIASSLNGKLNIVKNASNHIQQSIFKEALAHLSDAAELLDRSGDTKSAQAITDMLAKFADEFSPFAEYDVAPETAASEVIDELQNQINALQEKDAMHVQSILEANGFEVDQEMTDDVIKGHKPSMGDEPEIRVVVSPDDEPGMTGHWIVEADDTESTELEEEPLARAASQIINIAK